jgi:hypothetical protein
MTHPTEATREAWLDRFFEAYFLRRPVDATFIGARGHDDRLPDVSLEGLRRAESEMLGLLREWESMEASDARGDGASETVRGDLTRLDCRLAAGHLRLELWEHTSRWRLANPSVHVGEAVFGLMSLLLPRSAPSMAGSGALIARLRAVQPFLADARTHLDAAPEAWTERAIRECRGALRFLREGLPLAPVAQHDRRAEVLAAAADAAEAFQGFARFLGSELIARPSERVGCGAEAFELHLREGHFLDRSADEIAGYAREEVDRTRAWLAEAAPEFGGATPDEVLDRLRAARPTRESYLARHQEVWQAMRALADERALVSWPDFPLRYVLRPEWSRAAAPDLYFLFYRSPAAFDRPAVHDYLVEPLPADATAREEADFLTAHNDAVIKLNHVIHHGGIGHHVQNWNAFRSPLRTGRVAAVDGASRIAMFCGGTMAEGWACYATDLMAEAGGLRPEEVYAEHHGRVRMAARAVVDVELHHGRMTLDEAAAYYVDTAGMTRSAARSEAVKNSMFPGAALMYLVGTDLIHELRAELIGTMGDRFVLRDFHDALLSYGSIPVRVVADEMRRRASRGDPLYAHAGLEVDAS